MKVLKKFAAYYKPYKKIFYLDLLCAAIISAVDLIYPQILRSAANQWFTGSPESIYRILGLLFAALAAWAATALEVELLRKCFGGFLIVIGGMELFGKGERS